MKVLIVDDEPVARLVLRELLEEIPGVSLAGEAGTGAEAVDQVSRLNPDVLLLDVHMPGLDGLSVARSLRGGGLPLVIYVTAHQDHALEAFDTGAVDYLLKPVRKERLQGALAKARSQLAGVKPPPAEVRRIVGRIGSDMHMISTADVIAFQAAGDSVTILTQTGRYYSDHTLKALEEKLPPPRFRRIHRATIINTDHIRRISPLTSKRWLLIMSNGMEAIVSKRMAGVIREATNW